MDELNQLGKYLKKSDDKSNYALDRVSKKRRRIERQRDTIDSTHRHIMYFHTDHEDQSVMMDLYFYLAFQTPSGNTGGATSPCGDGICTICETFTSLYDIDQPGMWQMETKYLFISGSVTVYWGATKEVIPHTEHIVEGWYGLQHWIELLQGVHVGDTVIICYNYAV